MIGKVFNKLNKKWIRWSIYSIALLYLTFFRMDLDRNHLFITSDGQIKFYQTVQIAQGEFSKSNCLYPGRDLDPEYKFYIFDYPWAFFNQNGMKCAFQYSPYFPSVASLVYNSLGERYVTILPLVFWFLSLIIFDLILVRLSVRGWINLFTTISLFFGGFLSLSALDYAELSMNDFLFVSGLYFFVKFLNNSMIINNSNLEDKSERNLNINTTDIIGFVVFFSSSILLRPEGFLGIFFLIMTTLFVFKNKMFPIVIRMRFFLPTLLTGFLMLGLFFIVNYYHSGNFMGFRASNTGNDMKELYQISEIGKGLIADLWKSEFKVGLFFALPAIFTVFPLMSFYSWSKRNFEETSPVFRLGNVFFISGLIAVFLIPVLSPYRAGYHHFGNRYFETTVIICFIGGGLLWEIAIRSLKSYYISWGLSILFIFLSIISFRYTKEGFKVMKQSSLAYGIMMDTLLIESEDDNEKYVNYKPVVHKSLFTNYLVGSSFLKQNHFLVTNVNMLKEIENKFVANGIKSFIEIEYMDKPKYMSDIPKKLYDEKIDIQVESNYDKYSYTKEDNIFDFKAKHFHLTSEKKL